MVVIQAVSTEAMGTPAPIAITVPPPGIRSGAGGRQAHLECSQPLLMVPLPFLLAVHQQDNRRHQNQRHHDAGQGDDQTFMHRFTLSADKPSSS